MTEIAEVFYENGKVEQEGDDPVIWKEILSPGRLELTPGPHGTKVKRSLTVVEGHSTDPENVIGLQDLMDSYEQGAIQHVTIPTSHNNTVLENTGFIRGLRMVEEDGRMVLKGGFEFLDPEVHDKVKKGLIANVSCGILRNYQRQRDGRPFNAVIDHVALTNKPWVDGMTPFAQFADEIESTDGMYLAEQEIDLARYNQSPNAPFDYTAHGVEEINPNSDPSKVKWDSSGSMLARRHNLEESLEDQCPGCSIIDYTPTKVLVEENDQMYVTGYAVKDDGSIEIHPREEWLEYTPTVDLSDNKEGGKDPMDEVLLAEKVALEERLAAAEAKIAEDAQTLAAAAKKERGTAIKDRIRELGALGLSEYPGFLNVVEEIMLADMGIVGCMNLSEDGKEVGFTTTDAVERLINALPKKDDRIVLSEQHTLIDGDVKPDDVEKVPSVEERAEEGRKWLGIDNKKLVLS